MATKSKQSTAAPRRKARRLPERKAKLKLTFKLTVEGQEMLVDYEPNWLGDDYGHFEFRSPHEPPQRILVSETGYLSHFAEMGSIKAFQSPMEYARGFVLSSLNDGRKPKSGQTSDGQLSLF